MSRTRLGVGAMALGAVATLASDAPLVLAVGIGLLVAGAIGLAFAVASPRFLSDDE